MTRKDYKLVADEITQERSQCMEGSYTDNALLRLAMQLSNRLAADNARFSREKFMLACTPKRA